MSSIQSTITRIRAFAAHRHWKKSKFAAEAGLPDTTLRHFHSDDWNPTKETLEKLEKVIPAEFDAADVPPEAKAS